MNLKQLTLFLALTTFCLIAFSRSARAGDWTSGTVTNNTGSRNYQLWIPSQLDKLKPAPLVMMLHGCTQKAQDLATASGMNDVAERNNFLVVYPEQTAEANPLKCWNWFEPKHQARDGGEPSLLASIIKQVRANHKVDARRVYVVGISAGGAMAVVMGATYPDLFSGIGVSAGLEYKAASSVQTGLAAMKQGGPDPGTQARLAWETMNPHLPREVSSGGNVRHRIPVIVFQGDSDPYVNPLNADQLVTQWIHVNDYLDEGKLNESVKTTPATTTEGAVTQGHQFTKSIYRDRNGRLLIEKWTVKGLGHAWSGSAAAGMFSDPRGPNASEEIWRFFREASDTPAGVETQKQKSDKRVESVP